MQSSPIPIFTSSHVHSCNRRPEGGTGKTTCCIELAVTAARAGEAVAIIDLDPQTNAANWKDRRVHEDNPAVVSAQPGRLKQTLDAARENGADLVLIDTPGKNDNIALGAARLADLVFVPCHGSILDMETLPSVRISYRRPAACRPLLSITGSRRSATALPTG